MTRTQGRWLTATLRGGLCAVAVWLIQLVWVIPGVLVPLLGAHLPRKEELATLEQDESAESGAATPSAVAKEPFLATSAGEQVPAAGAP